MHLAGCPLATAYRAVGKLPTTAGGSSINYWLREVAREVQPASHEPHCTGVAYRLTAAPLCQG